jgi:CheY-like chemotaxis protein
MNEKTILVVEDDTSVRYALSVFLEIAGINFIEAMDGTEALTQLATHKFDLILCDINLPDILGYEILKHVRSNANLAQLPFIFLTAYADMRDVNKGLELGANDYITKPFSNKQLIDTVNKWLHI